MDAPTEGECQAALEAIVWEWANDLAVSEYDTKYEAGHSLRTVVVHVDAGDVLSLTSDVVSYIRANWPLSPDAGATATDGATTAPATVE